MGFGFMGFMPGMTPFTPEALAGLGLLFIALAVIFIVLAFLGAFWLYSGDKTKTMYGGIVTLVIAIIAFPTIWGLVVGSILGFVGGILGLVWSPTPAMPAPTP